MKHDMDLIRKLVLAIEDDPIGYAPRDIEIDEYTPEQIAIINSLSWMLVWQRENASIL
jgi:hypothetical protein